MKDEGEFNELIEYLKTKNSGFADKLLELYKNNLDFFHHEIKCPNCGKSSRISFWIFILESQRDYYGSSPEDVRWADLEAEMCHMVCPECKGEIGIYRHPQKNEILGSIQLFGKEDLFAKVIRRKKPRL